MKNIQQIQRSEEGKGWYKQCRPHLEWVNWEVGLNVEEYVERIVANARKMNSDTLIFPWESGGYLLYPGKLAPMYDNINGCDLMGTLIHKAHEAGLRFVVCFLGVSGNGYMSETHPDWVQRNADGSLIPKWPGYQFRSMCPNSPYSDYLHDVAVEIMSMYPVDGIYLEGVYIDEGHCHCEYCKKIFTDQYGREIPTENLRSDREYNAFRIDGMSKPFAAIRRAIDGERRDVAYFACIGASSFYNRQGYDAGGVGSLADVVCIEGQWNYDMPLGFNPNFNIRFHEAGLVQRLMKAESGKDVLGTIWISKHVDQNYGQRSEANIRLNFYELMFQGSLVQVHTQNALEIDPRRLPVLKELYDGAQKLLPFISDAKLLPYLSILDGADPADIENFFDDRLKGIYKTAVEEHLPVNLITPHGIERQGVLNCSVLFVPGVERVSDAAVDIIEKFVHAGGGLVLCGKAVANPRLARIAGVRYDGMRECANQFPNHEYFRVNKGFDKWDAYSEMVLSYIADRAVIELEDGTQEIAEVLGTDDSRKSEKHIIEVCYPGKRVGPLVTERNVGAGRVVTIAAELDAAARRFGDPDAMNLLATAIRYAGNVQVPIRTNAPGTVEVVVHRKPGKLAVLLLNGTTNQYVDDPIRYVVELKDIAVEIDGAFKPKSIASLSGAQVGINKSDNKITLHIDCLCEYEGVLIDIEE